MERLNTLIYKVFVTKVKKDMKGGYLKRPTDELGNRIGKNLDGIFIYDSHQVEVLGFQDILPTFSIDTSILTELSCSAKLECDWPLTFPSMKKLHCYSVKWHELLEPFQELESLFVFVMDRTMELSRYPSLITFKVSTCIKIDFVPKTLRHFSAGSISEDLSPAMIEASRNLDTYETGNISHPYAIISNGTISINNVRRKISLEELCGSFEPHSVLHEI